LLPSYKPVGASKTSVSDIIVTPKSSEDASDKPVRTRTADISTLDIDVE